MAKTYISYLICIHVLFSPTLLGVHCLRLTGERQVPKVDLFMRTFARDLDILNCSLDSLKGLQSDVPIRQLIVVVPETDMETFGTYVTTLNTPTPIIIRSSLHSDMNHNNDIWHADAYSDADYFVHLDADMRLHDNITLFSSKGTSFLRVVTYEELRRSGSSGPIHVSDSQLNLFFGSSVSGADVVVLGRQVYPREAYGSFRKRVEDSHHSTFDAFVRTRGKGMDGYMALAYEVFEHFKDKVTCFTDLEEPGPLKSELDAYGVVYHQLPPLYSQGDGAHHLSLCHREMQANEGRKEDPHSIEYWVSDRWKCRTAC